MSAVLITLALLAVGFFILTFGSLELNIKRKTNILVKAGMPRNVAEIYVRFLYNLVATASKLNVPTNERMYRENATTDEQVWAVGDIYSSKDFEERQIIDSKILSNQFYIEDELSLD